MSKLPDLTPTCSVCGKRINGNNVWKYGIPVVVEGSRYDLKKAGVFAYCCRTFIEIKPISLKEEVIGYHDRYLKQGKKQKYHISEIKRDEYESTKGKSIRIQFVSGGLPSLGKRR